MDHCEYEASVINVMNYRNQNELDMFKDDVPTTQQTCGFRYESQPGKGV
jgi:hypothetical protein